MVFEYFKKTSFEDSIEIADTGNCCIQAFTDAGEEYILMIQTDIGYTIVKKFGPYLADIGDTGDKTMSYYRFSFEYKESKIIKIIKDFLNNTSSGGITQVFEIPYEEAYNKLHTIKL